ncbi:MAG: DUF3108 domain-containing protein [Paludibacteraceae bacterium]|nr:DUF3108 domain-containing protein [Paludibacteraceae bacterium]
MKRIGLLLVTLLMAVLSFAKTNKELYLREPVFQVGEKATYNIYFNLGFIWVHAGDVKFECSSAMKNGKDCYKLSVTGYTLGMFEKYYVIRDTFVSYIDKKTLDPVAYEDHKHEDKYISSTSYVYTPNGDSVLVNYHRDKKNNSWGKQYNIAKDVYDLISCCYTTRNINTDALVRKQQVPLNMMYEDGVHQLGLSFQGKKNLKVKNGTKYKTMYFTPSVISGGLFKHEEDLGVYVADDANHIPVYVEAKLKMGSAVASLEKIEGAKYPITSIIKR